MKRILYLSNEKFLLLFFSLLLIIIYDYLIINNAISLAYVPDETWFYTTAIQSYLNKDIINVIFHVNDFGYGGIWWSIYVFACKIFSIDYQYIISNEEILNRTEFISYIEHDLTKMYPLIFMRLINILLLNIVFFIILKDSIQRNSLFIIGLIILLLTPMLYWSGKMASPEITAVTIEFIAIYFILKKKYYLGTFLLLFSCGLKPTLYPIIIISGLFVLYRFYKEDFLNLKSLFKITIFSILGFLLSNPILVFKPLEYFDTLLRFKNMFQLKTWGVFDNISEQIEHILFKKFFVAWDFNSYGSLEYWSYSIYILATLFLFAFCFSQKKEQVVLILLFFIGYILFMLKQPFHNWYFFSVIILIPFLFYDFKETIYSKVILFCLMPFLIILQLPKITQELNLKNEHLKNIEEFKAVNECIGKTIVEKNIHIKRLFNNSEIGLTLKYISSDQYINYIDSYVYTQGFKSGDMFILGTRPEKSFPHLRSNFFYNNSERIVSGQCGFVDYFYIEDKGK